MRAGVAFSSVAALLLTACTAPTDPNTAAYWIYKLDDKRERSEALKQLGRLGDESALPQVLEWFEKEGDWQPDAAYALGQLGNAQTAAKLEAGIDFAVSGSDRRQARNKNRTNINIVRALAMLGATQSAPSLIQLLETPEPTVREATIKSLGKLGSRVAVDPLIGVAEKDEEPFLRKTAIQALGDIADPKAIPTLVGMLFNESAGASFYNEARYALIQMGDAAVPALLSTLERKNETVEAMTLADGAIEAKAGSVLGYLGARKAEPLIIGALNRLYRVYSRAMAARSPVPASVPGAIRELCYAAGNLGTKGAIKALLPIASDADETVRETAADALIQIGDRSVVKSMLIAARAGSPASRIFAMQAASRLGEASDLGAFDALGKTGNKAVPVELMKKLVERERVRLVAAQECKAEVSCWRAKLRDPDVRVRDKAAWEIGYLGGDDARDDLLQALEDDSAVVRMAAVLSLGRLGGVDPDKLEEIHDKYAKKLDYAGVNLELKRLIARLKAERRKNK